MPEQKVAANVLDLSHRMRLSFIPEVEYGGKISVRIETASSHQHHHKGLPLEIKGSHRELTQLMWAIEEGLKTFKKQLANEFL